MKSQWDRKREIVKKKLKNILHKKKHHANVKRKHNLINCTVNTLQSNSKKRCRFSKFIRIDAHCLYLKSKCISSVRRCHDANHPNNSSKKCNFDSGNMPINTIRWCGMRHTEKKQQHLWRDAVLSNLYKKKHLLQNSAVSLIPAPIFL